MIKRHTTVNVSRKCWWGTFYYGGGPGTAFLLANKGPVWTESQNFWDLIVWRATDARDPGGQLVNLHALGRRQLANPQLTQGY